MSELVRDHDTGKGDDRQGWPDRRSFLRSTIGSVGAVATGALIPAACAEFPTFPEPAHRSPLVLPPELGSAGDLHAAPGATVDLGGGRAASAWGYNDLVPGPTIRVRRGAQLDVRLRNGLSHETTIHWHGMVVPDAMDGHPRDAVPPGGTYAYSYPVLQRPALSWYHPHPHGRTGEQSAKGLAGLIVVEDDTDDLRGFPPEREIPLVVRDARLGNGGLGYEARDSGFRGGVSLLNGVAYPEVDVDTALYRLRVLNAANARVFRLALDTRAPLVLIGNDGGLLESPTELTEIELGPAERLDLLIDLRGMSLDERVTLRCDRSNWDLLEFVVRRMVDEDTTILSRLSTVPPLPRSSGMTERTFTFEGHHRINGQKYEMDRVDFRVPRGKTELWRFVSDGGDPHPVHVHGAHFQVVSRRGGRGEVFPWERGWKDTVLLEDDETVEVLVRFDAYSGLYLLHCHKLEHEDGGMMMNFEVT